MRVSKSLRALGNQRDCTCRTEGAAHERVNAIAADRRGTECVASAFTWCTLDWPGIAMGLASDWLQLQP